MLKEISVTCPICAQETVLAVSSPQPGVSTESRMSITQCRRCAQRFLAETSADGVVHLFLFPLESQTPPVLATIHSAFSLQDIVRIPFGIWQPRGETIDSFQHRSDWAKALSDALENAQSRPRPLSVPRRIFLSYRWRSQAEDAWVSMLFDELQARGNRVTFDHDLAAGEHPPTAAELVAYIANCHVFLAVLDPDYIQRVARTESEASSEGWVTDEFHTALEFARRGKLVLLGLLREGDRLPPAFRLFEVGKAGNTFDVRDAKALFPILDQFFIQFGSAPSAELAALAESILQESQEAAACGDSIASYEAADCVCRLVPGLADGFAQRARVAYRAGKAESALSDARRALEIDPTLEEMLIFGSAAACDVRKWKLAARLSRLALERNRRQGNSHYLIGYALLELGQIHTALAHFSVARSLKFLEPQLFNAAGLAWCQLGRPIDAMRWFEEGMERLGQQEAFLANLAVAAIEAGLPAKALDALLRLKALSPQFEGLGAIANALARLCQQGDDEPPPVLTFHLPIRARDSNVTCTACSARIPLDVESDGLCFGCGAPRPLQGGKDCIVCMSAGVVTPTVASMCPICGDGTLTLSTLARSCPDGHDTT